MSDYLGPYLLGPNDTPENGIYTGDARELAKAIPNESVQIVWADPIYSHLDDYRWLAEISKRVLINGGMTFAQEFANVKAAYRVLAEHKSLQGSDVQVRLVFRDKEPTL